MIWGITKASENIASMVANDPSNSSSSKRSHEIDSEVKQAWSKLLTFLEPGKKKIKADSQGLKEDISTDVAIIVKYRCEFFRCRCKWSLGSHRQQSRTFLWCQVGIVGHLSLASL